MREGGREREGGKIRRRKLVEGRKVNEEGREGKREVKLVKGKKRL